MHTLLRLAPLNVKASGKSLALSIYHHEATISSTKLHGPLVSRAPDEIFSLGLRWLTSFSLNLRITPIRLAVFSGRSNSSSFSDVPPLLEVQSKTTLGSSGFLGCHTAWWGRYYIGLRLTSSSSCTCLDDPSVWYFSTTLLYLAWKTGSLCIFLFNHVSLSSAVGRLSWSGWLGNSWWNGSLIW